MSGLLEAILDGRYALPDSVSRRLEEVIGDWYYAADGLAHERIADCILGRANTDGRDERLRRSREFASSAGWGAATLRQRARDLVVNSLGLPPDWSFRRWKRVGAAPGLAWWLDSEKFFGAEQVEALSRVLEEAGRGGGQDQRRVRVSPTQERGDYLFGHLDGQSVTISPE
jgi:hypothetical protein